ncbi:MAG: hypothetical protein EXX96DRAFT_564616 [Benjaminiella poitrasii]|nr:MAG: hypothetical protein EXX96DRAFT_564616 [Benjaminiella poitrasii]
MIFRSISIIIFRHVIFIVFSLGYDIFFIEILHGIAFYSKLTALPLLFVVLLLLLLVFYTHSLPSLSP